MRKFILRLLCGLAALAVVTLSLCFSGKPVGAFPRKAVVAGCKAASVQAVAIPPSFGAYIAPAFHNIALPNMSIFPQTSTGVAMTHSAASAFGSPLAIGSLAAGFGSRLANTTETAPDGRFLPTTLAGATVTVIDWFDRSFPARLAYASPTQINHEIPADAAPGPATIVYTNTVTGESSTSDVELAPVAPGLFGLVGDGTGIANALVVRQNASGSTYETPFEFRNCQAAAIPIDFGPETDTLILALFGTGFRYRSSLSAMTVTIGGIPLPLIYAGLDGGERVGLDQANIALPRSLAGRGLVDITMTVDGMTSNTVQLSFR